MLITDLDDTLLNDHLEVGEKDRAIIQRLEKEGIPVVLCSGRATYSMIKQADKIFETDHPRYIIAYNGAEIIQWPSNKIIYQQGLAISTTKALIKLAIKHAITIQVYKKDYFLVYKESPEANRYCEATQMPFKIDANLLQTINFSPSKVLLHAEPSILQSIYSTIEAMSHNKFNCTFSKPHYIECTHLNVNKGNAMRRLSHLLKIDLNKTIAIGDSLNDKQMLLVANTAVAVANAREEIKEIADYICMSTNNENPIEELYNRYYKIK